MYMLYINVNFFCFQTKLGEEYIAFEEKKT